MIHLSAMATPPKEMDWSNNPEGYKIYLADSKKAAEMRAESDREIEKMNKDIHMTSQGYVQVGDEWFLASTGEKFVPTSHDEKTHVSGFTNEFPVYVPAKGTEVFVLSGGYKPIVTGTFNANGDDVFGTLYKTKRGAWLIVTPEGQVQMSGSVGAPPPLMVGQDYRYSVPKSR